MSDTDLITFRLPKGLNFDSVFIVLFLFIPLMPGFTRDNFQLNPLIKPENMNSEQSTVDFWLNLALVKAENFSCEGFVN